MMWRLTGIYIYTFILIPESVSSSRMNLMLREVEVIGPSGGEEKKRRERESVWRQISQCEM